MGETIYGKFGPGRTHEEPEQRDHEYITLTVTYRESACDHPGSVMDAYIEDVIGEPPNHCGSGFGKRDMGWVFPKEDIEKINTLVKKVRALNDPNGPNRISGIDVEIDLTDADGNPN